MKSSINGKTILDAEVTHIDVHGLWVAVGQMEYFLSFAEYPWFKDATVSRILDVQLLHESHLYWPQLDVDLDVECLENPQHYPLLSKS